MPTKKVVLSVELEFADPFPEDLVAQITDNVLIAITDAMEGRGIAPETDASDDEDIFSSTITTSVQVSNDEYQTYSSWTLIGAEGRFGGISS